MKIKMLFVPSLSRSPGARVDQASSGTFGVPCVVVLRAAYPRGMTHNVFPNSWPKAGGGGNLHSPSNGGVYAPFMNPIHKFNLGLVARMVSALDAIRQGNTTLFDNTAVLYMSDNADCHHSRHTNWPVILMGTAGGKLKSPGNMNVSASLIRLHATIANAFGVSSHPFGAPIPELTV